MVRLRSITDVLVTRDSLSDDWCLDGSPETVSVMLTMSIIGVFVDSALPSDCVVLGGVSQTVSVV